MIELDAQRRSTVVRLALSALALVLPACDARGGGPAWAPHLKVVDTADRVLLSGNVHPLTRSAPMLGATASGLRFERMILTLALPPGRHALLQDLLARQQDPASPDFHRWLTPEEFGARFGPSEQDLAAVTAWLTDGGFTIEEVARGRTTINFSGTVAQVRAAFDTPINDYLIDGAIRPANAREPSVPRSLSEVVSGVVSLHGVPRQSMATLRRADATPSYNVGSSHYVGPGDFATIYNLSSLYGAGLDGAGQTIAVTGRTHPAASNWAAFRNHFSLAANPPTVVVNGADPGDRGAKEDGEADLDVEWAGAVARSATIAFVTSASTASTDGVDLSAQYIVNANFAAVLSTSFAVCEATLGSSGNAFYSALWAQAAAQGISVFVASGDSGGAGCNAGSDSTASGRAVNGLASTPNNVAVGGTLFYDPLGQYWSADNGYANQGSAIGYVPEVAWNESAAVNCSSCTGSLWASGGGTSTLYDSPAWQVAPGVPAGKRSLPDVALAASSQYGYVVYTQGTEQYAGGTSAATPAFAGLMALVVQKTGQRQGNPGPRLYQLGNAQYGSFGPLVFHDITTGNSDVPGLPGYRAGPGYDLVTGLGSVDAAALVSLWSSATSSPDFTLGAGASSLALAPGTSATTTLATTGLRGFAGSISLSATGTPADVTASFSASTVGAPGAAVLTVSAAVGAAPVSFVLWVSGASGNAMHAVPIAVTLSPPSITLTSDHLGLVVPSGGAATATLTTLFGGVGSDVSLSVTGTSTGLTAVLDPPVIASPGSGASTLTVTTDPSLAIGNYRLTITASGAGLTATAPVLVAVTSGGVVLLQDGFEDHAAWSSSGSASWALNASDSNGHLKTVHPHGGQQMAVCDIYYASNGATALFAQAAPFSIPASVGAASVVFWMYHDPSYPESPDTVQVQVQASSGSSWSNAGAPIVRPLDAVTTGWAPAVADLSAFVGQTIRLGFLGTSFYGNDVLIDDASVLAVFSTPDFALAASPIAVPLAFGASVTSTVSATAYGGFASDLSLSVTGTPAGITASFVPGALVGAAGASVLTLAADASAQPGLHSVTVVAAGGGLTRTLDVAFNVVAPDFSLQASPTTLVLQQGASASSTVTAAPLFGFASDVALSVSGTALGLSASFSPALLPGGGGISTLTVTAASSTAPGDYPLGIVASSGGLVRQVSVTVTVALSQFTLALDQVGVLASRGGGATCAVSSAATAIGAPIDLVLTGAPPGVTAAFDPPSLAAAASGNAQLTLSVASSTPLGSYPLTLTGTSGTALQNAQLVLAVAPGGATLLTDGLEDGSWTNVGSSFAAWKTVASFSSNSLGTVLPHGGGGMGAFNSYDASAGETALFVRPGTFTIPASATAAAAVYWVHHDTTFSGDRDTLQLMVSSSTSPGWAPAGDVVQRYLGASIQGWAPAVADLSPWAGQTLQLAILGTSAYGQDEFVDDVSVQVVTPAPDFALSAAALPGPVLQGSTATSTVTGLPANGFSGDVLLSADGAPAGTTVALAPATLAGGAGSATVTIAVGTSTAPGTYAITVTGTGAGLTRQVQLPLVVAHYAELSLSAAPGSLAVVPGQSATSTITSSALGSFSAGVTLSASGLPAGATASFSPSAFGAPGAGAATLTLSVGVLTADGTYPITITGTGGGLVRSTTVSLSVVGNPTLGLSASPSTVVIGLGGAGTSTLSCTTGGGFDSDVALSVTGTPAGLSAALSLSTLAAPGTGSVQLGVLAGPSLAAGSYPLTVAATGGGFSKSVTVTVEVVAGSALSLDAAPASVTIARGSAANVTLTTLAIQPFSDVVALSAAGLPAGATATFSPATLPAPGSGTSSVLLSTGATTPSGDYTVTLTGSAGSIARSAAVALHVTGPSPAIAPADPASLTVPPGGGIAFSASGGSGQGYSWTILTNRSGATIDAATGAYVAGRTGEVVDVVRVVDSLNGSATANVVVTAALAIAPLKPAVAPLGKVAFSATGGSGSGFVWSLAANASGGAIVPATGRYTAGSTGAVTDVVQVTDALGNIATRSVPVGAGLALTPATLQVAPGEARTITASGGSGAGLTWTLTSNASGGSVVPGAGGTSALYTAGHAGGVTDTLQVADSLGNVAGASITVTAGLRIAPASAKPPPRGAIQFTASGGGPGSTQVWSLLVHPSGGSISSATGAYTAGPVGGVTDVVGVSDALGNSATSTIAVGPGVSVAASATSAPAGGAVEFTATGGSGQDFTWAITANSSGGTIDAATGAYRAGATSGGTDTIQAEDSLGNTGTASVAVVARPAGGCGSTGGATGSWVLALVLAALQRRRR